MNTCVKQWMVKFAFGVVVVSFAAGQWSGVAAQDAVSNSGAFVPDPAACQSQPRTIEEITSLFAAATPAAELTTHDTVEVPIGVSASDIVSSGVKATITEAFACLNAGDFGRFLSLLTDQALVINFPWIVEAVASGEISTQLTSPAPPPEDMLQTILAVGDVKILDDGRAAAVVSYNDPAAEDTETSVLYMVFTFQHDRWIVDEVFDFSIN